MSVIDIVLYYVEDTGTVSVGWCDLDLHIACKLLDSVKGKTIDRGTQNIGILFYEIQRIHTELRK